MTITLSPYITNQPQNTFLLNTQGYVQGVALDDPSSRMYLAGGTLGASETLPMWGGVALTEYTSENTTGSEGIGPTVIRALTGATTITAWSVFNQAPSMVIASGNTVPLADAKNYVSFYRTGSNARIAVKCDSTIVALGATSPVNATALYFDLVAFQLTTTSTTNATVVAKLLSVNTNSKVVSWSSPNATWATGNVAIIQI